MRTSNSTAVNFSSVPVNYFSVAPVVVNFHSVAPVAVNFLRSRRSWTYCLGSQCLEMPNFGRGLMKLLNH